MTARRTTIKRYYGVHLLQGYICTPFLYSQLKQRLNFSAPMATQHNSIERVIKKYITLLDEWVLQTKSVVMRPVEGVVPCYNCQGSLPRRR